MTAAREAFEEDVDTEELEQRPAIFHNGRQLDAVVQDGIEALAACNNPPALFVRGGQITRLRADEDGRPLLEALRAEHVRLHLSWAATWWKRGKDAHTATAPPLDVATSILASHDWPFPSLAGVVELPVLRPDGTFHLEHGYDPPTRLYHWHNGVDYPAIPDRPSKLEVKHAIALIDEMLCDFPWDTTADRANAWGLLLTPLVRPSIGQVPLALVDAPEAGTGKTLLVNAINIIATGTTGAMMAWPTTDEELEKKVTAALMAGQTSIIFDNANDIIKSPILAAVLTSDTWGGRILGKSEMVTVPNRATWFATGNNMDVGGDLARRCYRIRLDSHQANPFEREDFRHADLPEWVTEHRGRLVAALCTIVRAWVVAGRPLAHAIAAMGGFTSWVRVIGGILDHAGIDGFLANLAEFRSQADREAQQWEALLGVWLDAYGESGVKIGELITAMEAGSTVGNELKEALPEEISGYWGTAGFSRRLSLQLRKRVGRHYGPDGYHLVELPRDRTKVAIYSVTTRPSHLAAPAEPAASPLAASPPPLPDASSDADELFPREGP